VTTEFIRLQIPFDAALATLQLAVLYLDGADPQEEGGESGGGTPGG
jgi:hypothetical protein